MQGYIYFYKNFHHLQQKAELALFHPITGIVLLKTEVAFNNILVICNTDL